MKGWCSVCISLASCAAPCTCPGKTGKSSSMWLHSKAGERKRWVFVTYLVRLQPSEMNILKDVQLAVRLPLNDVHKPEMTATKGFFDPVHFCGARPAGAGGRKGNSGARARANSHLERLRWNKRHH